MCFQIVTAPEFSSDEIATLFRKTRQISMPYLPELHSLEEDKIFFKDKVFKNCQVYSASNASGKVVGFMSVEEIWIEALYIDPDFQGEGIGSALVEKAKSLGSFWKLWCFQKNTAGLEFYKKHGFEIVKKTSGEDNEEKEPDCLLEWRRPQISNP